MQAFLLLAGAVLWAASQILKLMYGSLYAVSSTITGLGFLLLAVGLTLLWNQRGANLLGRTGTAIASSGLALLGIVYLGSIGAFTKSVFDLVGSPLYDVAAASIMLGATLIGIWIIMKKTYPIWVGFTILLGTAFSLGSVFFWPQVIALQPAANLLLALALGEIALLNSLGEVAGRTTPARRTKAARP